MDRPAARIASALAAALRLLGQGDKAQLNALRILDVTIAELRQHDARPWRELAAVTSALRACDVGYAHRRLAWLSQPRPRRRARR